MGPWLPNTITLCRLQGTKLMCTNLSHHAQLSMCISRARMVGSYIRHGSRVCWTGMGVDWKQGKSEGFYSCDRPSNVRLDSNHRFLSLCDLEIWLMTLKNNRALLLYYINLCIARPPHQPLVILSGTPELGLAPLTCGCWQINSLLANIGHRNSIRILNPYPFRLNILIRS